MTRRSTLTNITREVLEPVWRNQKITVKQIGDALGVSDGTVCKLAQRLGLPSRGRSGPRSKMSDDLFRRMWLAGVRSRDIAEFAGYSSVQGVSTKAAQMGLPKRVRQKGASIKNGTGRCGFPGSITLAQFYEDEMARRMHEAAR